MLGILTQVAQVITNKREIGLLRIHPFDAADALHGFLLRDVAAKAIDGIGGINDHTAIAQHTGDLLDQTVLRINGMYVYEHRLNFYRRERRTQWISFFANTAVSLVLCGLFSPLFFF